MSNKTCYVETSLTVCVCVCMCVGRGRRRLDFKRFQGKSLFLDLPGYRQVARLEEELTARGAVSEREREGGEGGGGRERGGGGVRENVCVPMLYIVC